MRARIVLIVIVALFFAFCKKKKSSTEETVEPTPAPTVTQTTFTFAPGTQLIKLRDADLSSGGYHDNATSFFYYDTYGRMNLVKEYDTTMTPAYVVTKIGYKESIYTYNSANKVTVESITSYSPTTSNQTNNYYYDGQQRLIKKVTYFDGTYFDSTAFTYVGNKIISKYGYNGNNVDTSYINPSTQNIDSAHYMSGYTYKYLNDLKPNPFATPSPYKDRDLGASPYRCDYNIRKIRSPFGVFTFSYTYNANNYPNFYTTILSSGSGCNVYFTYN